MRRPNACCLFLLVCLLTGSGIAQKQVETQQLLWMRYFLRIKLNKQYNIRQEFEERTYWFPWRQHQFVARTFLERDLGAGWNTGIGITLLEQALPHNPEVTDYTSLTELRPQLEMAYRQSLSDNIQLHHRFWTELRFMEQEHGSFEFTNNRSRYKLELVSATVDRCGLLQPAYHPFYGPP